MLLALPGWEDSAGSRVEITRAMDIGVPVYYSIKHLLNSEKCLIQAQMELGDRVFG
jgi:hypothetical protein